MGKKQYWISFFLCLSAIFSLFGAERPKDVLVVVQASSPSNLDSGSIYQNEGTTGVSMNIYDRLLTYGLKTIEGGVRSYDYQKLEPQLAESWEYDADGTSIIFHLRKDAVFHDGSPVTAEDVKWSFERAIFNEDSFPSGMMKAGGMIHSDQFIVIDDHTIKIKLSRKDKLTLPDLGTPVPSIFNSKLVKQHATDKDPWGFEWTKNHDAGGGAFKLESFIPDVEIVYVRNDQWKSGPLPKLKKIIVHIVQSPVIRKKMLEEGLVDVAFELPPEDNAALAKSGKYQVIGVPIESSMYYLDMNVKKIPFNDLKVRQAIAYAMPYDKIFETIHGRGIKLYGTESKEITSTDWPQPTTYSTNIEKAKALLKEANYPNGFKTDLYIDMGSAAIVEPIAKKIQEGLKNINVDVVIHRVATNQWRKEFIKKEMPMLINSFGSWLNYPDYFFFWNYHGQNATFNTMSYQNPEMDKFIEGALHATSPEEYQNNVKAMITKAYNEVPRIPLFQMYQDVVLQPDVHGYVYWFFRQLVYSTMYKENPEDKEVNK